MFITTNQGQCAIYPYKPLINATENWQFNTDVFEAVDSTEERIALRDLPRQTLKYSYAMAVENIPRFFNLCHGAMRSQWAVPLWFEGQSVASVAKGSVELSCITSCYTFSSLAILWQSPQKWQVVEINTVQSDGLILDTAVSSDFGPCRLYPVKVGWISGDVSRTITGITCMASVTFVIDDLPVIAEEVVQQTFNQQDLCFKKPLLSGDALETTLSQQQDIIDFGLGIVAQSSSWKVPKFGKPFRHLLKTQQELYAFKQWLMRRIGQYRPFYMPSFESNLRIVSLSGNVLIVQDDDVMSCASNRLNLAMKAGGEWYAVQATKIEQQSSTQVKYTLASNLGFSTAHIQRISYLGLYRLNSDSIDFTYKGAEIVEANTSILEIDA